MTTLDVQSARAAFEALRQPQTYFDNAGGSQTLSSVAASIQDYLDNHNVQLGASYNVAKKSTAAYDEGMRAAAEFIGAAVDEIAIGPSTTQLLTNLSLTLPRFPEGSEIIISRLDHEANIAPWVRLARQLQPHLKIVWWDPLAHTPTSNGISDGNNRDKIDPTASPVLTPESLKPLLSPRTVMVSMTHASNILGTIHDILGVGTLLQSYAASASIPKPYLCVDGVAYAPHRQIKLRDSSSSPVIDFYSFSWYKVFGPHVSALYASRAAQTGATGHGHLGALCHYFKTVNEEDGSDKVKDLDLETRLGLAGASYELVASLPKVGEYIAGLGGHDSNPSSSSTTKSQREEHIQRGWDLISVHESTLSEYLLSFLRTPSPAYKITIHGHSTSDPTSRVAVISFTVQNRNSREIVERIEQESNGRIGCRWGHFYSKRLVDDMLGLWKGTEGVVRVSMVHYNTVEEVQEFVEVLRRVLEDGGAAGAE